MVGFHRPGHDAYGYLVTIVYTHVSSYSISGLYICQVNQSR